MILTGSLVHWSLLTWFASWPLHGNPLTRMDKNRAYLNEASRSLKSTPLVSLLKINLPCFGLLLAAGLLVFIDIMKELLLL